MTDHPATDGTTEDKSADLRELSSLAKNHDRDSRLLGNLRAEHIWEACDWACHEIARLRPQLEREKKRGQFDYEQAEKARAERDTALSAQQSAERELAKAMRVVEAAEALLFSNTMALTERRQNLHSALRALDDATEGGEKPCEKCGGAGWVWWNELEHYEGPALQTGEDDTRYSCDRCRAASPQTEGGESSEADEKLVAAAVHKAMGNLPVTKMAPEPVVDALRAQLTEAEKRQSDAIGRIVSALSYPDDANLENACEAVERFAEVMRGRVAEAEKREAPPDICVQCNQFREFCWHDPVGKQFDHPFVGVTDALRTFPSIRAENVRLRAKCSRQRKELRRLNASHARIRIEIRGAGMSASAAAIRAVEANSAAGDWCAKYRAAKAELATAHAVATSIAEKTAREQRERIAAEWEGVEGDLAGIADAIRRVPLVTDAPSKRPQWRECSDALSGGIPCPPGECPNAPSKPKSVRMLGSLGMKAKPSGRDAIAREIASWDAPSMWHCPRCGADCSSNGCTKCAPQSPPAMAPTCKHGAPNCTAEHE